MASAPSDRGPVLGRLDSACRLIAADPELALLQEQAGSRLGAELALPQVLAIARLALKMRVAVSRPATVAGDDRDIDLWVRAQPAGGEVALSLERWSPRAPASARLSGLVPTERQADSGPAPEEWVADEELRLLSLSPGLATMIGIDPAAVAGQPLTRLFKLEEDDDGNLPLIAGVAARADFGGQRARLRNNGQSPLILTGTAVLDGQGRFIGYRGEVFPADRVPPAGSAPGLADIDAALDDALRSPLDRIIDSADRIVQQSEGPLRSDYADYATDIAAAARHLLGVVRSMTGEDDGHDRIDLSSLAADAVAMLESAAEARGVIIALSPAEPLDALGAARGVIQILVNLIGNAVRHSPKGGIVAVSFDRTDDSASVHVADRGPGIDPADQQRIFERFEQANDSGDGAGLGLAIARRLARAMGGDIILHSEVGAGARFTLILPAA